MNAANEQTPDLFVTYAESDCAWVEGYLLNRLRAAKLEVLTQKDFQLGAAWTKEFERAVSQSNRVLLVLSDAYMADVNLQFVQQLSRYHDLETKSASVFSLFLDEIDQHTPLIERASVSLRAIADAERTEAVDRLLQELKVAGPAPPQLSCPYPGMKAFRRNQAAIFHGRKQEIENLIHRLQVQHHLFLIGATGSGKSSLVLAGLIPALEKDGWRCDDFRPGDAPRQSLKNLTPPSPDTRQLLVIDQFEELFTAVTEDEAAAFQVSLMKWVKEPNRWVVLTVRADFFPDLMLSPLWKAWSANHFEVLPLNRAGMDQAIVGPARERGVFVEPTLVERLLSDAAHEPGTLPLLQETLRWLWEKRQWRYVSLSSYESMGREGRNGLQEVMGLWADAKLNELCAEEQVVAQRIFLRLIQFGEGRPDTRRQQLKKTLLNAATDPQLAERVINHLIQSRLLTARGSEDSEEPPFDIAHDALIGTWVTLQEWVRHKREAETSRRQLQAKVDSYQELKKRGGLLDAVELRQFQTKMELCRSTKVGVPLNAEDFVRDSKRALRIRRIAMVVAWGSSFLFALVATFAAIYWYVARNDAKKQTQIAKKQARIAESRRLTSLATSHLEKHETDVAILLAVHAWHCFPLFEAKSMLRQSISVSTHALTFLHGPEARINEIALSADGQSLACASNAREILLWDLKKKEQMAISPLKGHPSGTATLAYSPDHKFLAAVSCNRTVYLWDITSRPEKTVLLLSERNALTKKTAKVHCGFSLRFLDKERLAFADLSDETLRIWHIGTQKVKCTKLVRPRTGFPIVDPWQERIIGVKKHGRVVISPGAEFIAAEFERPFDSKGSCVVIWDVSSGKSRFATALKEKTKQKTLPGRDRPTSKHGPVAVVFADGNVRFIKSVIDWKDWDRLSYDGRITQMVFNSEATRLAIASKQGVYLYNTRIEDLLLGLNTIGLLSSPMGNGPALALSGILASSAPLIIHPYLSISDEASAVAWCSPLGVITAHDTYVKEESRRYEGHNAITSLTYSSTGEIIATGNEHGIICVLNCSHAYAKLDNVGLPEWIRRARQIANRNFSQPEWENFFPDDPYRRTFADLPSGRGAPKNAPVYGED